MEDYNDKNSLDGKVQQLPFMAPEKRRGKKEDPWKECKISNGDHTVHTMNVASVYQVSQMYKLLHI